MSARIASPRPDAASEKHKALTALFKFPISMFYDVFRNWDTTNTTRTLKNIWLVSFVLMSIVTLIIMVFEWCNDVLAVTIPLQASAWSVPALFYAMNRHCLYLMISACAVQQAGIWVQVIEAKLDEDCSKKKEPDFNGIVTDVVKTHSVGWVLAIFVAHCTSERPMWPFEMAPVHTVEGTLITHIVLSATLSRLLCQFYINVSKEEVWDIVLIFCFLDTWLMPSSFGNKLTSTAMAIMCKHFLEEVLLKRTMHSEQIVSKIVDVWVKYLDQNDQLCGEGIKSLAFTRSNNPERSRRKTTNKEEVLELLLSVKKQKLEQEKCQSVLTTKEQYESLRTLLKACCNNEKYAWFFIVTDTIFVGGYACCQYFDWTARSGDLALLRLMAAMIYLYFGYQPIYNLHLEIAREQSILTQLHARMVKATTTRSAVFAVASCQSLFRTGPPRRRVTVEPADSGGGRCVIKCGQDLPVIISEDGIVLCRQCVLGHFRMPVQNNASLIQYAEQEYCLVAPPYIGAPPLVCDQCHNDCDRQPAGCFWLVQNTKQSSNNIATHVTSTSEHEGFNTSLHAPVTVEELVNNLIHLGEPLNYFDTWFRRNTIV